VFAALIDARRGKVHIDVGRPAQLRAWAFADGDALLVEPEPGDEAWRFPFAPDSAREAAERLVERWGSDSPLFITLIDVG
jgi:hypothetical protein